MHDPSLPVIIPLLVAAILAGTGGLLPRRVLDAISIATAAVVCALCCHLIHIANAGTIVYWFGNWRPTPGAHFPIGICFMVDPVGAALAAFVALLVLAALIFSWAYFESIKSLYHALMLVFLASMCGLCLTGDLFNLFVWFELMTATAVGLCGYKSEESWPLLGALNFAVCNTVAAFLSLTGIAILYAFTGSLNMCEVGRSLSVHNPGTLLISIAFLLIIAGFLVKAAAFPFHFWLADAHAVAPTPVCILLSGVMVELGIYAIARLYWIIFAPLFGHDDHAVQVMFIAMGCIGAVLGGVMCFGQRHLKRLLAFSTISHVGLMFIGFGLLKSTAMAGLAMYVIGHGAVKGALFICAGILLHRFHSVDEFDLRGRGREIAPLGFLMLLGAWGLAGLPPFATFHGQRLIDHAAEENHMAWLSIITICAEALTGGAVLRVVCRVFLGWGPVREATSRGAPHIPMGSETGGGSRKIPAWMWLPAAGLLTFAMVIATFQSQRGAIAKPFSAFVDGRGYQSLVLDEKAIAVMPKTSLPETNINWLQVISLGAVLSVAGLSLFPTIFGKRASTRIGHFIIRGMRPMRLLQSGRIGDYIAWLILGIAAYGGLLIVLRRS